MSKITSVLNFEFPSLSKRWSQRNKRSLRFQNLKEKVRNFLALLSGDDFLNMLLDILKDGEKNNFRIKHIEALNGLSEVNNTNAIYKHSNIRPIRLSGLTLNDAKSLGFEISKNLWKSCLYLEDRKLAGRKGISEDLVYTINRYIGTISYPASNKMILIRAYN